MRPRNKLGYRSSLDPLAQSAVFSMGTVITCQLLGSHADAALAAAEAQIQEMNRLWSRFDEHSEISNINAMAGLAPVPVSEDTFHLLKNAKEYAQRSAGLFDITIAPLTTLWDSYKKMHAVPVWEAVQERLKHLGCRGIVLDEQENAVGLSSKGQMIDLGGIAKGCASDRICSIIRQYGIQSGYTDFGGNVAVVGGKPDGSAWKIGIRHPRKSNALVGVASVRDCSVVTSGDDQRYYCDKNGVRYHHILDPRTGYPANSGLASVTVIAASGEVADVLSTALFIAGEDQGKELLRHFPNVDAIYVREDGRIVLTPGADSCFIAAEGIPVILCDARKGAFDTNEE